MKNIQYGKYDLDHNGQLTEDELITAQNLSDRTPEEEKEMNSERFWYNRNFLSYMARVISKIDQKIFFFQLKPVSGRVLSLDSEYMTQSGQIGR